MTTNDGGPAFPAPGDSIRHTHNANGEVLWRPDVYAGMSLRDWFAGQALVGMMVDPPALDNPQGGAWTTAYARDCYRLADAMLAERAKVRK